MLNRFVQISFLVFSAVFLFYGCDKDGKDIYGDGKSDFEVSDSDDELTEYMERPDSDNNPGGGGIKTDNEIGRAHV